MSSTGSPATEVRSAAHALSTQVPRNKDGYWVIGDPEKGCQFCGDVSVKEGEKGGKTAWYHPSVECCADAITRQIEWRRAEMEDVRRKREADDRGLEELRRLSQEGGIGARDAAAKLPGATRGISSKNEHVYGPQMRELAGEIHRLQVKRAAMREEA